ncbi:aldo/keto reductase [Hazenella sp. IB182353]|uniref:aldo/keto reductase n=1 Tax=Polycladospora coralii TaxID=2771432 RepID=UPI001746C7A3|nr:aldo/keto reductase [Polycladospora coralii]MBS7530035.1 aldo/keto reductase [Polycladospora coralii]
MNRDDSKIVTLYNQVKMPVVGLGVWKADVGGDVETAVKIAVNGGYRLIDTATIYENEIGVGQTLRELDISREQLFITTKVWNTDQGYENTLQAFELSRKNLGLEYVDLYLIHWPIKATVIETWKAMEHLYQQGYVKAIGVSNFEIEHLEFLMENCQVKPMVNQVEFHPHLTQKKLLQYCKQQEIQVQAWSPLMRGNIFEVPLIQHLAHKYHKTPAQIVLRWDLQHGVATIPKSIKSSRIQENIDIFAFEIEQADMDRVDALNEDKRYGSNPNRYYE